MFSYYGSKSKVVHLYPKPKFDKIIEPFAGSAAYSLRYYNRQVWINDLDETIYKLWRYLQNITLDEINSIPALKEGDDIRDLDLSDNMRLLLGFVVGRGVPTPRYRYTSWSEIGDSVGQSKARLLKYHGRARNWKVTNLDYRELPNIEATWFIDPPYQYGGEHYKENNKALNFAELAEWCKSRRGQVIVCENTKANWLPFYPMHDLVGSVNTTTEAIWSNYPHNFMARQSSFFEVQP